MTDYKSDWYIPPETTNQETRAEVSESALNDLLCLNFDQYGYPADETLKQITEYNGSYKDMLKQIAPMFDSYGRCEFRDIDKTWEVVTGGWSGNESLVEALADNKSFWAVCWRLSKRGGYYEFTTKT